ncbi:hypothetical protein C8A05DRAFT_40791 [Staphylotrichum tortipilum]|uniref:Uncharacterized protein n=1 Tax=Staphylotrichum tortipilum TaxID=2831512 RepID=A0AAN6MSQ2_9PEZI|nr:hypothetical protein C8A05DRAFT_40791 [Staphylotrichum longicolle]
MCTWSYSHYHHAPSCSRPIDIVVIYRHCDCAWIDPATGEKQPCNNTFFSDDAAQMNQLDANNPCASGGCLPSPDCSSGECRLMQLGHRWMCCQCGGRGNEYKWCQHSQRTSPDTFCYHVCCEACRADPNSSSSGGSSRRSRR